MGEKRGNLNAHRDTRRAGDASPASHVGRDCGDCRRTLRSARAFGDNLYGLTGRDGGFCGMTDSENEELRTPTLDCERDLADLVADFLVRGMGMRLDIP